MGITLPRSFGAIVVLTAKILCVLAFVGATAFFAYALHRFAYESDFFEIKTLVVKGVSSDIAQQLRTLTQLEENAGINLLNVSSRRVRTTLLRHPKIRRVRISKHYPNALIIEAEERIPVAIVSSDTFYLVDREGYVLEDIAAVSRDYKHLPLITGIDSKLIALGEPIPTTAISQAIDLFECLYRQNERLASQLSEIHVHPQYGLTLMLKDGVEVRMGREEFAERLTALELISRKRPDFDRMKYIDLRFKNQIVYRPRDS